MTAIFSWRSFNDDEVKVTRTTRHDVCGLNQSDYQHVDDPSISGAVNPRTLVFSSCRTCASKWSDSGWRWRMTSLWNSLTLWSPSLYRSPRTDRTLTVWIELDLLWVVLQFEGNEVKGQDHDHCRPNRVGHTLGRLLIKLYPVLRTFTFIIWFAVSRIGVFSVKL